MNKLQTEEMNKISPLFEGWEETLLWSCLQGYMGNAWADQPDSPKAAQIIVGDFCFFAGEPTLELVQNIPEDFPSECILMIPRTEEWSKLIEKVYQSKCERITRYAIKKEADIFDREKLQAYIQGIPEGYRVAQIDENIYNRLRSEAWSKDLCSQFPNYQKYKEQGLGFVALYGDQIVSGASSYSVYLDGIEIEIDTKEEFRRKGLALACGAKLILECLERGLYPSWDAQNLGSVALAEKLGYHFDKEYVTYAVFDFLKIKY